MTLFMPAFMSSGQRSFCEAISANKMISVRFYNARSMKFSIPSMTYFFLRNNRASPWALNSLAMALYVALQLGYREIGILGADHSWHQDIVLDSKGRLGIQDTHFYQSTHRAPVPVFGDSAGTDLWTIDRIFGSLQEMFRLYWDLGGYATALRARVTNYSSRSYIDAFPRTSLSGQFEQTQELEW